MNAADAVFDTIRRMLETPIPAKKPTGFHASLEFPSKSAKPTKPALNNTN
jgi:hypothetical protein